MISLFCILPWFPKFWRINPAVQLPVFQAISGPLPCPQPQNTTQTHEILAFFSKNSHAHFRLASIRSTLAQQVLKLLLVFRRQKLVSMAPFLIDHIQLPNPLSRPT
jgi:hypothetical protein